MNRPALVLALLLVGAPAIGAESSPQKPGRSAGQAMPASKETVGVERKPVEPKAGEAPKASSHIPRPPLPALEGKNLGLGCAQS